MLECSCTSGTEENYWFEEKCENCLRLERDQWEEIIFVDGSEYLKWMKNRRKGIKILRIPVFVKDLTGKLVLVYDSYKSSAEELNSPTKIG